jgi:hypothetical protein
MKRLTSILLKPVSMMALSVMLTACDSSTPQESQAADPFSEHGLPSSQRQQEDSAAGVKFGDKQRFKPLVPPSSKNEP